MLILSILLELLVLWPAWRFRRVGMFLTTILTSFASTGVLIERPNVFSLIVCLLGVFRVVNYLRIAKNRMHEVYQQKSVRRSGLILSASQLLIAIGALQTTLFDWSYPTLVQVIAGLQLMFAIGIAFSAVLNIRNTRYKPKEKYFSDRDLPTVTVAVPARNETTELQTCLDSLLASDYQKLEILVLDDCSQDATSETIKKFAHAGVRFLKGTPPHDSWLAKNHAYQQLYEEASGSYILFCGVDTHFEVQTIRNLTTALVNEKLKMLSVLPRRYSQDVKGAIVQPMRYWWELAVPRRMFGRPPVLSTCWMIDKKVLKKHGGFGAVMRSVVPEAHFAKSLFRKSAYRLVRASSVLDVQSKKPFLDQKHTALRMRYPQLHKRPEMVALLLVAHVTCLFGPLVTCIYALIHQNYLGVLLSFTAWSILNCIHISIVYITNPPNAILALVNYPFVIVYEVYIEISSMLRYEFGEMQWKDRNICLPVMHVTPHLPKID